MDLFLYEAREGGKGGGKYSVLCTVIGNVLIPSQG